MHAPLMRSASRGPLLAGSLLIAALTVPQAFAGEAAQREIGPIAYACTSGRTIIATYINGETSGARLVFDGRTFALYAVRSGSGARYATEQGLKPDHGLQWWIKGDDATLSEMVMDDAAPPAKVIDTCRAAPAKN